MNPDLRAAVLAQSAKRESRRAAMLEACAGIPQQLAAIDDPSLFKGYLCTRRAGKSYSIGIQLFLTALDHPGCSCLYLGLTKDSAINTMNKDILAVINRRFGINATWNESKRLWRFPNGSLIYLRGADANAYEIAKVVGQKYRLAVLDEASKYRYNIHEMVYGSLVPAMGDDLGTIILSGTPSNITSGLFYEVTTGARNGWAVHRWTWQDNVFKRDNIAQLHAKLLEDNPLVVNTSLYKQEWLGQWIVDKKALVYKFDADLNQAAALPRPANEYHYLLGVDLGYSPDPTALVVGAYHDYDPTLFLVQAIKREGIIIDATAKLIKSLWREPTRGLTGPYPFARMVCDAAALQSVEEMRQRCDVPLESAKKTGKRGVIEVFNSDLQVGRIKVLPGAMDIVEEWGALIWDEKKLAGFPKKWEEDPRVHNDLCLAAGTLIECGRGRVPIEDVVPGDVVITRAGWRRVTASWCSGIENTWRLGSLIGTANHPVWTEEKGMVPLASIGCGVILLAWANSLFARARAAAAAVSTGLAQPVYNLTVEGAHEYVANGLLVSNCDAALYMWRAARNYDVQNEPAVKPAPTAEEFANYHLDQVFEDRRKAREQNASRIGGARGAMPRFGR